MHRRMMNFQTFPKELKAKIKVENQISDEPVTLDCNLPPNGHQT